MPFTYHRTAGVANMSIAIDRAITECQLFDHAGFCIELTRSIKRTFFDGYSRQYKIVSCTISKHKYTDPQRVNKKLISYIFSPTTCKQGLRVKRLKRLKQEHRIQRKSINQTQAATIEKQATFFPIIVFTGTPNYLMPNVEQCNGHTTFSLWFTEHWYNV